MENFINIAIDGPAGAGKSTIAKKVSKMLGYVYIDTGAMYRAMAYGCMINEVDLTDENAVVDLCSTLTISLSYENDEQQIALNGININKEIRTQEVSNVASKISVYGKVRKKLVEIQQQMAYGNNIVMDGRDIGTCVLKDAKVKIYLTADANVRAKRRYDELIAKGVSANLEQIEAEIIDRDYRDMNREISPLTQAEDAILVDSSYLTIDEVVDEIINIVKKANK